MTAQDRAPAKRVLFVDDDPLILSGLQRSLRQLRSKWQLSFASSGKEALAMMNAAPFDVLVTDMLMPGMNGADLIEQVHQHHPATIRIILSGQADQSQLLRCIPIAHRFLPKPCEPAELGRVLERISSIEDLLRLDRVRRVISQLTRIPSVPSVYLKIISTLQNPEAGIDEVADVVVLDPGTTAGLLRIVNSAYFALARRITDAREAVRFLGIDMVRTLALAVGAFDQLKVRPIPHFCVEDLWSHSMATASIARAIARHESLSVQDQDLFFITGLLHDLGRLILADNLGDDWNRIVEYAAAHKCAAHVAEAAVIGVSHAEVAGGLFGLWGLPTALVDGVTFHHAPSSSNDDRLTCALAVHCADHFSREREVDGRIFAPPELDVACIRASGLEDRIESWRRLAS